MLRIKKTARTAAGRTIALMLALLIVASFMQIGITPASVSASGSATLSGGETININLSDSSWQGSDIRVKFLNSSGDVISTTTKTPMDNKISVTGVNAAAKIRLEKVNATKSSNITAMNAVISAASSTQTVVFYDNTSSNWTNLKYYAWSKISGVTYKDADWNSRKSMTNLSGTKFYSATIDQNSSLSGPYQNIIFTGSDKQTADLTLNASTANNIKVYSSTENKWVSYTDVDRSIEASFADRVADNLNDLYITSKTSAKWSKYNSSTPKKTVYFKPNSNWGTAYVHYDDDDDEPFYTSVAMTTESTSPLIFKADVYLGAMVSFSDGADFKTSSKKDQGSVFSDEAEPVYVSKDRNWTTLELAKTADTLPSDFSVTDTNFSSVTPTGGGKVVGFDAYYYDYYSNNERSGGWRSSFIDDNFSDSYRKQFSNLNDELIAIAKKTENKNWRYPLIFGDDDTADRFIVQYYNDIKDTRTPSITEDNFKAANNSNFLGGDNERSILGFVKSNLKNGNLYMTDTLKAPYFDNDWLMESSTSEKEVLYILDNNNLGQNNIYCNFWNNSGGVFKDAHPEKVADSVSIGSNTGTLYRYVVDKSLNSVQLASSTNYGSHFYEYLENGSNIVGNVTDVILTSGGTVSSTTYRSGIQNVAGGARAKIISSKFPFVEKTASNGVKTYTFDSNGSSRKDNIAFEFNDTDLSQSKLKYYNGEGVKGKLDNNNGFFPFNTKTNNYPRNYGFGVRVDMDFTLPENGMLNSNTPAQFNYSGDDDVWVFVDGQLILDLGGAHRPTTGSINFGAGVNTITSTANKVYGEFNTTENNTQVFEFVFSKPSSNPSGYLAKWSGGQYPGSGQTSWSSLNGKAFFTSGKVESLSGFNSYDDASGKRHIFIVNDSNKSDVAVYSTDNSLGNWDDCVPSNSSYKSKVSIYPRTYTQTVAMTDNNKNGAAVTKTFSFNNTDPTKKHKMTVFYMERGTNDSNLRIEFSIQPILNELDVYKEVEIDGINNGIEDRVDELAKDYDFDFTFNQNGLGYGGSAGKKYNIVHADDSTTTNSIKNGSFKLKHYEEAMFKNDTDLTYGSSISVSEAVPTLFEYDTSIDVKDNLKGSDIAFTQTGRTAAFDFKNADNDSTERTSLIAEYTNTLKTGSLKLNKNLYKQNSTEASENFVPFTFTVSLDLDKDGTYETYDLEYKYSGHTDTYIAEDGVVQMRPDQQIIFEGIPAGTPYKVREAPLAGYKNKGAATQSGTIAQGENSVTFNNEESPATTIMGITKELDGAVYSGNEFTFRAEILRWEKPGEPVPITTGLTYHTNEVYTINDEGRYDFDPFEVIPDDDHKGDYIFKISEIDKTDTQPKYNYDSTVYYAKITVSPGTIEAPVYYTDEDCTTVVGTDGKTNPTFVNTTKKGSITVNKTDADNNPVSGTQFALIKVSSQTDVDEYLTPDVINTLVTTYQSDANKVNLKSTTAAGSVNYPNLPVYQADGQFVYSTTENKIVWSNTSDDTEKQTYCIFEYSPTDGYLPNYTKSYVVLADKEHFSETFSYVDGKLVMPNSSGWGTNIFLVFGLGIIGSGVLLTTAYAMKRRLRPRYKCRH